jgi:hypothetical protein
MAGIECPDTGGKWDQNQRSLSDRQADLLRKPKISGCLSEQFPFCFGLGPSRGSERFDLGNPGRRQAHEQILQVIRGLVDEFSS